MYVINNTTNIDVFFFIFRSVLTNDANNDFFSDLSRFTTPLKRTIHLQSFSHAYLFDVLLHCKV